MSNYISNKGYLERIADALENMGSSGGGSASSVPLCTVKIVNNLGEDIDGGYSFEGNRFMPVDILDGSITYIRYLYSMSYDEEAPGNYVYTVTDGAISPEFNFVDTTELVNCTITDGLLLVTDPTLPSSLTVTIGNNDGGGGGDDEHNIPDAS